MSINSHSMISDHVREERDRYADAFARRDPFRHVVIDDFFSPEWATVLLSDFPAFEKGNALSENGELGGKSTYERIRELGPNYAALDDAIQSEEFLKLIGTITGIPNLLYDPYYFGGGTHENRSGQDLDPHVDFNRHPVEGWHRRLNLIVYLNHTWEDAWGGSLEIHSDPRSPEDRVELITPLFNRCIIFETTENSWHGFSLIRDASSEAPRSRRSIALYFYSRERPPSELADTHSTIYVERPLPAQFRPGRILTDSDVQELQILIARRDQHNQRLYGRITELTREVEDARHAEREALYAGRLGRIRRWAARARAAKVELEAHPLPYVRRLLRKLPNTAGGAARHAIRGD